MGICDILCRIRLVSHPIPFHATPAKPPNPWKEAKIERKRKKTEQKNPLLEEDIRSLVENDAQADPKFQSTFCYARISVRAVREALIDKKGYTQTQLPTRQTIGEILNRLGYRLKKPKKQSL